MNDLQSVAAEMMGTHARRVVSFVNEFHRNPELRARCQADPHAVLAENGVDVPLGYDVRFVADTAEVHHFVLPPDPNASLDDDDLEMVVGGKGGRTRSWEEMYRIQHYSMFNSPGRQEAARAYQKQHNITFAGMDSPYGRRRQGEQDP